jgi:hypothetical protein
MSAGAADRTRFADLIEQHRHLRAEHRAAGVDGRVRRHLERRLAESESRIEGWLAILVGDEDERRRWRDHLHHGAPAPPLPPAPTPVVFRGVTADGTQVEALELETGEHRLFVDGAPRGPIPPVSDALPPEGLHVAGMVCRETFAASPRALAALRGYVAAGTGDPPWEHVPELVRDGLVDPELGLTARGRRALARWAG